jgi:hypothetical protein
MDDLDELFHFGVVMHRYWFSDWKVLSARQLIQEHRFHAYDSFFL